MGLNHPPRYLPACAGARGWPLPGARMSGRGRMRAGPPQGRGWLGLPDSGVSISAESECCFQQSSIDLPHPRSP